MTNGTSKYTYTYTCMQNTKLYIKYKKKYQFIRKTNFQYIDYIDLFLLVQTWQIEVDSYYSSWLNFIVVSNQNNCSKLSSLMSLFYILSISIFQVTL